MVHESSIAACVRISVPFSLGPAPKLHTFRVTCRARIDLSGPNAMNPPDQILPLLGLAVVRGVSLPGEMHGIVIIT